MNLYSQLILAQNWRWLQVGVRMKSSRYNYLTRALEKGFQLGEKPITAETAKSVLSPDLNALEPNLARHGYNVTVLCDYLNTRRSEIKSYLRGQLNPTRQEEINKEVQKLGVLI